MSKRTQSMNLESLHAIATMVAQQRKLDSVLETVVQSLIEDSDLALARIWLVSPGDICTTCQMRTECPDQNQCLHLAASAACPKNPKSGNEWYQLGGFYSRIPIGVRGIGQIGASGQSVKLVDTADDNRWFARNDWLKRENVKTFSGHPLVFRDEVLGVLAVFSRAEISDQQCAWLKTFADHAAVAIANARAFEEIEELKRRLELENEYLRDEIRTSYFAKGMIGKSPALLKVLEQVELVAPTDTSVLIQGESGVGKELIARAIHDRSPRADLPMIKVNCASVPGERFESEIFGHVKGSFTGAIRDRAGRFELANGGTLFLDEVGEIPHDMQGKLLRVLQEGTYERIGDEKTQSADVRIIAATNRNLQHEVQSKRFRQDLYYRLSVFPIDVVPVRDRRDDIPELTSHFLEQFSRKMGIKTPKLKQRHIIELQQYNWPGNIRELQNVVERAVIVSRSGPLEFHLPRPDTKFQSVPSVPTSTNPSSPLLNHSEICEMERNNLLAVLEKTNWKISGNGGAAAFMGMPAGTLSSKLRVMGIKRPR